jgi:hypothetical protein
MTILRAEAVSPLFRIATLSVLVAQCSAATPTTGRVVDANGKPIAEALIQVVVVDGRIARIPEKGTFVTQTEADGTYKIIVFGPGRHRILATKDGYEPRWIMVDGVPSARLSEIMLKREDPPEIRQLHVGDKVMARDFEWCKAEVVTLGTTNTATPTGTTDLSGRFEVKWDETGTTQWLRRKDIRMRPKSPLANPIRCPSLPKQDVAKDLMKTVEKKLN